MAETNRPLWGEIYQELINAGLRSANHDEATRNPLDWGKAQWQGFFEQMAKQATVAYTTGCDEYDRAVAAGLVEPDQPDYYDGPGGSDGP